MYRPLIADIDNDGKNECIISVPVLGTIFVAKCIGDNKIEFVDSSQFKEGIGLSYHPVLNDFDGDGKFELTGTPNGLCIFENTGGYKFELSWRDTLNLPNGHDTFSSKDSDGDEKPEIFIGYHRVIGNAFWLYRWEAIGDDSYQRIRIDSVQVNAFLPGRASDCGDVDGDGIDEIVWSIGKKVFVYKATGNDKYERVWEWNVPNLDSWNDPIVGIRVYDVNKNGYAEIIASVQSDVEKVTKIFEIDTTCLSISSHLPTSKPYNLSISPNPAKKSTVISLQLPVKEIINLKVYDATGRLIKTLVKTQRLEPKTYTIKWDGRDDKRNPLPSGVYFIRLETGGITRTEKVILTR